MKRSVASEFFFQVAAVVVAFIVVHTIYVTVIRPNADAILQQQAEMEAAGETYVQSRSFYVVVKDYEQEACFVMMLWALAIMGYKAWFTLQERALLQKELVPVSEGISVLPEDSREYARPVQALAGGMQEFLLPRALLAALQRFGSTRNVQDVSDAVKNICESESDRLDSELSMVRYIAWAIPSIGFIGTVRGFGAALGRANEAVAGDIAGVTEALGVAFNSTFIALVISIFIMFFMHQLQLIQERLVLEAQTYCDQHLIRHMQVR